VLILHHATSQKVKHTPVNMGRRRKAKTRGAIGFCLDFFVSFCIKAKRKMKKPKADLNKTLLVAGKKIFFKKFQLPVVLY